MNTTSQLTYLNRTMERLCKLYMAMQNKPHEEDALLEIRKKITYLYSEITIIKSSIPQSMN
jgi:hypothetical protein